MVAEAASSRRILDPMQPEPLIAFVVGGVPYLIRVAHAREMARRLETEGSPLILGPSRAAAILIEQLIEDPASAAAGPEWRGDEKKALCWALEEWLDEVGAKDFPEELMALRYALAAEAKPPDEALQ
jgi:hypothetical protein